MSNKEYIESGILALYVAGALPEDEMITLTRTINAQPELLAEVQRIEAAYMAYASLYAPQPAPTLLQDIHTRIQAAQGIPPRIGGLMGASWLGWLVGAIGLLGCLYLVNQSSQCRQDQQRLQNENVALAAALDSAQAHHTMIKRELVDMLQPNTTQVTMKAVGPVADAEAIVYWNRDSKNVCVLAHKLPEPPEGFVYQLWWMKSLEPLLPQDAGLLQDFARNPERIFMVKPAEAAQAFAITLEPAGGSTVPTLDQLYVFGTV